MGGGVVSVLLVHSVHCVHRFFAMADAKMRTVSPHVRDSPRPLVPGSGVHFTALETQFYSWKTYS